jgi:hypothetical protein
MLPHSVLGRYERLGAQSKLVQHLTIDALMFGIVAASRPIVALSPVHAAGALVQWPLCQGPLSIENRHFDCVGRSGFLLPCNADGQFGR